MRSTLVALAVALAVAGPLAGGASMGGTLPHEEPMAGIKLPGIGGESGTARTPRTPIAIHGDAAICAPASGVVNCGTADGSQANPYVVSGWDIDSTTVPALSIRDTTKWIVVRSNTLRSPQDSTVPAVFLRDATNLIVELNTMSSGRAVAMDAARLTTPITITGNQVTAIGPDGGTHDLVRIESSPDVRVTSNRMKAADGALDAVATLLRVNASSDAVLHGNEYSDSAGVGLSIGESPRVQVTNETFRTVKTGIVLDQSPDANLTGISMSEALDGVRAASSTNLVISSSDIADEWPCSPSCEGTGIYATDSTVTVTTTSVTNFTDGITILDSDGAVSTSIVTDAPPHLAGYGITVTGSDVAIRVDGAAVVRVRDSNVHGNGLGVLNDGARTVIARSLWWGCTEGPGAPGCVGVKGAVDWAPPAAGPFRTQ